MLSKLMNKYQLSEFLNKLDSQKKKIEFRKQFKDLFSDFSQTV